MRRSSASRRATRASTRWSIWASTMRARAAREAEEALMRGAELGPLHGVPAAIKDLFDFKPGWPATFGGIRALRGLQARQLLRVRRAGRARRRDPGRQGQQPRDGLPWRHATTRCSGRAATRSTPRRTPAAPPVACAAAVADGLLTFAEGTDGGGSIRIPASWCGIYGFKQSFGRVPYIARPNAFGGTDPFLFEGPLTRTVEDAALGPQRDRGLRRARSALARRTDRLHRGSRPLDRGHADRVHAGLRRLPDRPSSRGGRG